MSRFSSAYSLVRERGTDPLTRARAGLSPGASTQDSLLGFMRYGPFNQGSGTHRLLRPSLLRAHFGELSRHASTPHKWFLLDVWSFRTRSLRLLCSLEHLPVPFPEATPPRARDS